MLNSNIVRLRKRKGLKQIEFAKALGVSQSAVSHWETGRSIPETPQLFQLAEFFGISIDDLIGEDDLLPPMSQDTATVYKLDGQPTRGLRDDKPETQAIAAKVLSEALNHGMTEEEALAFIRNYAQLMPQERKTIMSNMMFLRSQHNEEEGT